MRPDPSWPERLEEGWHVLTSSNGQYKVAHHFNGITFWHGASQYRVEDIQKAGWKYHCRLFTPSEIEGVENALLFDICESVESIRSDRTLFDTDPEASFRQGLTWAKSRFLAKVSELLNLTVPKRRYRHKRRGTSYDITGSAMLQAEGSLDGAELVLYRDAQTHKLYARPKREFFDGRFERVETTDNT